MAEVTVTDQAFDIEVLKSSIPILVDFWAVWCVSPDTNIYKNSLDSFPARSIGVGDQLVGWNNRMENGNVSYSKTSTEDGHCRLITTESGRKLKITDDHQVFTQKGWVKANEILFDDKVAILPVREPIEFKGNEKNIVNSEAITRIASLSMQILKYIKELEEKQLLPLKANDPRILILARIAGALFSDGSLYQGKNHLREISFSLGRKEDVLDVINDLKALGFDKIHVKERDSEGNINGRTFHQHGFKVKCLSTALYLLLRALGVPEGRKLSQIIHVPNWILKGEKAIKREFLAGILGGDGPKISMRLVERAKKHKQPYNNLLINDYEFHKQDSLLNNGIEFANELKQLFEEFGVSIKKIFKDKEAYLRKDGILTRTIHIHFDRSTETGFALSQIIGYAYGVTKRETSAVVGEFLRILLTKKKKWQNLYTHVMNLSQKGLSVKQIAQKLQLSYNAIFPWVKMGRKATINYHLLKFPEWLSKVSEGLRDGFLWQEVSNISPVYLPYVQKITVEKTHNFVANGFLVHNCGPCRMQDPILHELEKEYDGKIKIAKLNVDDNPTTAAKYGIMSIPTLMLFKNGQIIKQMIGVQSKEKLIEEFNKVIN